MPCVLERPPGRRIVVTVPQACDWDLITDGGFPAQCPGGGEAPREENDWHLLGHKRSDEKASSAIPTAIHGSPQE